MATAKASPPLGVCGSQTKGLPYPFQGGSLAFIFYKFPRHWEGQTKEVLILSIRGTFFKSLSLPALFLPPPLHSPGSQVCHCSTSLSTSLGTSSASGL